MDCRCGGKYRRTDIVADHLHPVVYNGKVLGPSYRDTDPLVSHWRCGSCGSKTERRKRQPTKFRSWKYECPNCGTFVQTFPVADPKEFKCNACGRTNVRIWECIYDRFVVSTTRTTTRSTK